MVESLSDIEALRELGRMNKNELKQLIFEVMRRSDNPEDALGSLFLEVRNHRFAGRKAILKTISCICTMQINQKLYKIEEAKTPAEKERLKDELFGVGYKIHQQQKQQKDC